MKHKKYTVTPQASVEKILTSIIGCQFIRMQTKTSAGLRKTRDDANGKRYKHEHGDIQKISDGQFIVGFRYANSLANQAKREDKKIEFNVQPRMWGEHVSGTCLIEHKGSVYVETIPQKSFWHRYVDENGDPIWQPDIQDLIDHKNARRGKSSTQANLEGEVIVRDYKLTNVLYLVANHYTFGTFDQYASEAMEDEDAVNVDKQWDALRESNNDLWAMGQQSESDGMPW